MMRRPHLIAILLFFSAAILSAQVLIVGEIPIIIEPDPLMAPGDSRRGEDGLTDWERQSLEQGLEDARWILSGMIYGFQFSWIPSWSDRQVEETFELEPRALVPRGDPAFRVEETYRSDGVFLFRFSYRPDETQSARLEAWSSRSLTEVRGRGEPVFQTLGLDDAVREAVRQSLRSYLREREYNRPREVTGTGAFLEFPRFGIGPATSRFADVRINVDIRDLRAYATD